MLVAVAALADSLVSVAVDAELAVNAALAAQEVPVVFAVVVEAPSQVELAVSAVAAVALFLFVFRRRAARRRLLMR